MLLIDKYFALDNDGTLCESRFPEFVKIVSCLLACSEVAHTAIPVGGFESGVGLQFGENGGHSCPCTMCVGLVGTCASTPIHLYAVSACFGFLTFGGDGRKVSLFLPLLRDELPLTVHHVINEGVLMYSHCALPRCRACEMVHEVLCRHGDCTQKDGECEDKKSFHFLSLKD